MQSPSHGLRWQLLVAIAAVAVYGHTVGHGFVFDDGPEVVDNELIRSLRSVPRVFLNPAWKGAGDDNPIYRPLTTATYALNHAAGGLSPWGYHAVNVLLHAAVSLLVLSLGRALGLSPLASGLAAALFAVHPVHAEVVANVAGRKDALVSVFVIGAVLTHARAVRRGGLARALAPASLAAALFSKETGLAALVLLPAFDLTAGREHWVRQRRRALGLYAAYAALAAAYLAARWSAVGSLVVPTIPFHENPLAHAPVPERMLTAVAVLGRGLWLLLAPGTLSPDYSYRAIAPVTAPWDPRFLASVAGLGAVALLALRLASSRRVATYLLLWYAATVLPGSNLLVPIGTIFAERLLYLPSVAFCLGAGALAGRLLQGRAAPALRVAVPVALVALAARTIDYASVWADEVALFEAGVRAQPDSSKLHGLLGASLVERGRSAEAVPELERALQILEGSPASQSRPRLELGVALEGAGRLEEAEQLYRRILADHPAYADALWRLGVVRWAQGRRPEAVGYWLRTVAADRRHARAMSDLGIASAVGGDDLAAEAWWRRAAEADPALASVWDRLGDLHQRRGDHELARAAWREYLRRDRGKHPRGAAEVSRKLGLAP